MKTTLTKNWPEGVEEQLTYRLGEKPLHEYIVQNSKDYPNKTAYVFYGSKITWKQLQEYIGRFARFLKKQGVNKGDHIALYMQNCPQYIIGHYAIQMLGGIVVPLNPMYKKSELEYFIEEAKIKGIIAGQELYSELEGLTGSRSTIEFVVTTNYADFLGEKETLPLPEELHIEKKTIANTYDMLEMIETSERLNESPKINIWEDVGLLVFTSGTTGRPKGAMLTYGNALFKTAATSEGYQVEASDRALAMAPLSHIAGMLMGLNLPIYSVCECVLLTRFEPEAAITAIEKYQINKMYTIAPMNVAILSYPNIEKRDLTSLEFNFATSFGIKVDSQLAENWGKLTDGCLLFEASYGLSETHTADTFMPVDNIRHGSCGIAVHDTNIRIVDFETGKDLSIGEQGEIAVKNPGVFKGYFNRPDATEETLREGWVFTGDIGKLDEDGYLYFIGRVKEMIKSSGYSVFPEDVEALMSQHEAILQIATVGIPDATRGENVKAFIVLKPEFKGKVNESDIIEWAKGKMAAFKYPREVEFLDSLPATSSGKVLRRLLVEDEK